MDKIYVTIQVEAVFYVNAGTKIDDVVNAMEFTLDGKQIGHAADLLDAGVKDFVITDAK